MNHIKTFENFGKNIDNILGNVSSKKNMSKQAEDVISIEAVEMMISDILHELSLYEAFKKDFTDIVYDLHKWEQNISKYFLEISSISQVSNYLGHGNSNIEGSWEECNPDFKINDNLRDQLNQITNKYSLPDSFTSNLLGNYGW